MNNRFLASVTANLIARVGIDHLRDYCIIFPMQRASVFMRQELSAIVTQMTDHPIMAPEFQTIDSLVAELSQMHPDDEIRTISILHRLFCQWRGATISPDVFYGWGAQLRTDFSNIDMGLINADELFRNTLAAHELERPGLHPEVAEHLRDLFSTSPIPASQTDFRKLQDSLWQALPHMYHQINDELAQRGEAYTGARFRWVIEHWQDVTTRLGNRHFAFVGFNYLHRGEKELMRLLRDFDPMTLFYWDYNPSFTANADAYRFISEHMREFPNALPSNTGSHATCTHISVIATSGSSAQAQYVHDWLLEHPAGRTGVVIANEQLLEQVIYALPPSVKGRCNITKGYPLRLTSVYAKVVSELSDSHNGPFSAIDTLNRLLTSPSLQPTPVSPQATWQELLSAESVYQARVRIERLLALTEQNEIVDITDLKTLRNLVRRVMDSVSLPFHGDPMTEIQIIGVLETRLLDFDNLLILNVEEGTIPRMNHDISFIPYYLRKYYGLETPDESAAAYAYNFFRLLHRASNITLMFAQASSGTQQQNMSRFLMQLLTSPDYQVTKSRIVEGTDLQTREVTVNPNPALIKRLSPSSINMYLTCPWQFYLSVVEGIQPAEPESAIMAPNTLGTLIHATIRAAYMDICHSLPCAVKPEMIDAYLRTPNSLNNALSQAYAALNQTRTEQAPLRQHEHPVENQVALTHVRNVLHHDREHPFTLLAMESGDFYFNHPVPDSSATISIGGFLDRLDVVEVNGQSILRVVDYKTGKPHISDDYLRQTLVYAEMVSRNARHLPLPDLPIAPALFFSGSIKPDSDVYLPHPQSDEQMMDYRKQAQGYTNQMLEQTIATILHDTQFVQAPLADCTKRVFCPFRTICHR